MFCGKSYEVAKYLGQVPPGKEVQVVYLEQPPDPSEQADADKCRQINLNGTLNPLPAFAYGGDKISLSGVAGYRRLLVDSA